MNSLQADSKVNRVLSAPHWNGNKERKNLTSTNPLVWSVDALGPATIVSLQGEIDVHTSPNLRETLLEIRDRGCKHLILDLTSLEFMDSSGLGVLVGERRRAIKDQGTIALVCKEPRILKILKLVHFDTIFPIYDTTEDAIEGTTSSATRLVGSLSEAVYRDFREAD